jgi:hypothetical protein
MGHRFNRLRSHPGRRILISNAPLIVATRGVQAHLGSAALRIGAVFTSSVLVLLPTAGSPADL